MNEVKVFVSSREIELMNFRKVSKQVIEKLNMYPVLFEEKNVATNKNTNKAYIEDVENCHIFILILWKSMSVPVRDEYTTAVKEHKPILIFEREIFEKEVRDPSLNEFLDEYQLGTSQNFRNTVKSKFRTETEFSATLKESLKEELISAFERPVRLYDRSKMYKEGSKLIEQAEKRLYIFQRKATLFYANEDLKDEFGEEDLELNYRNFELDFAKNLRTWIVDKNNFGDIKFAYIFDMSLTKRKINKIRNEEARSRIIDLIKENLLFFKNIEKQSKDKFKFTALDTPVSGPLMIADNYYGLWILGQRNSISIYHENERISSVLAEGLEAELDKNHTSYNDIILGLGI